jgi:DNA-binding NarL/FixJ family response regulator
MQAAASMPIRALIVERQFLFAKALVQLLTTAGFHVVGDTLRLNNSLIFLLHPDLILIDIDGNGPDFVGEISATRATFPDVHIGALTMRTDSSAMACCLQAGADSYVVKDVTAGEFRRALRWIAAGERYVDPRVDPAAAGGSSRI